jgi:hypothetical protein
LRIARRYADVVRTTVAVWGFGATYVHLVPDSEEYLRGLLDAYDVRKDESPKEAQLRVR